MKDIFAPATRRWIYGVASALLPLLITLGAITPEIAGDVLNVLAAVLAVGVSSLAASNTTTGDE